MKKMDKELATIMNNLMNKHETKAYRFKLFVKNPQQKINTVGTAYKKDGQNFYWLKLRMFLDANLFLLPRKEDSSRYLLMTKDLSKSPSQKDKYFYNIVGSAKANPTEGFIEMSFDLLDKKVFMNISPEETTTNLSKEN